MRKKLKFTRSVIVPAVCFLFALIVGVAAVVEKVLLDTDTSVQVTKYIFLGYLAFFFLFIAIMVPLMRWLFSSLKIKKANAVDVLATILLIVVSGVPMIVFVCCTLVLLNIKILSKWMYHIYNWGVSAAIFLMGVLIRKHGRLAHGGKKRIIIANHTSPLDYLIISQVMGNKPWNVVAGINLRKPKNPTIGDRLIAASVGHMVEKYSISIDRDSGNSRVSSARGIMSEIASGKNVAIFPEGTRTTKQTIQMDQIMLGPFQDGAFRIAWSEKVIIQPVVFDFPVIWRGKNDDRWGVRPCTVDVYFLEEVDPEKYQSFEDFKQTCWDMMYQQLASSKKIRRFLDSK